LLISPAEEQLIPLKKEISWAFVGFYLLSSRPLKSKPRGTNRADTNSPTRALAQFQRCSTPMDKYNYLSTIRHANETLFYHLLINNMIEMVPIVYTPTVSFYESD
jgi:hypothetical protein